MRLSVLDQSPISEGSTGADALANTLDLAQLCERLGYHRYWLAEHHGGPTLAGPSPEALIGPVAAATSTMRIGSGGVMLPHYSPFKVAETFSLLAGLFPDRIDLGIGRAAGTDPMTTFALQRDRRTAAPDDFPEQLAELLAHYDGAFPADHPFARLGRALPGAPHQPEVWLLGSSAQSAIWAGQLGLPYAFADFINAEGAPIAVDYRMRFSRVGPARAAAGRGRRVGDLRRHGRGGGAARGERAHDVHAAAPGPPDPGAAARDGAALPRTQETARRGVIGSPATVRAGIEEIAARYGAEEVIVVTITYDHGARRRSYELIAEAFGMAPADGERAAAHAG